MKKWMPALALAATLTLTGCAPSETTPYTASARATLESLESLSGAERVDAILAYASTSETELLRATGIVGASAEQSLEALRSPLIELSDSPEQFVFAPASIRAAGQASAGTFLGAAFVMIGAMADNAMTMADSGQQGSETGSNSNADGTITISDGSVSTKFVIQGTEGDSSASVTSETQLDYCPDPEGEFELIGSTDVSVTVDSATISIQLEVTATGRLDDTATLVASDYTYRHQVASSTNGQGEFFDHSSGARLDVTVNRSSSQATLEFAQSSVDAAAALANMVANDMIDVAKRGWESGRCVDLKVTPSEDAGSLEPEAQMTIEAAPVAKSDGEATGGTITATLAGEGQLDPDGSRIATPATFDYTAGEEKNSLGTVTFESRSNRGVGKAALELQVGGQAYSAKGTEGDFTATGTICSLTSQFVLTGNGLTLTFSPVDDSQGSYRLTGAVDGVTFIGDGDYTVTRNAEYVATNLVVIGDMTLTTPEGVTGTSPANIDVVLTPIDPCE